MRYTERREDAWRATRPHALEGHFTTGGALCTCPRCGARPRGWDDLGNGIEGYDCVNCGAAFIYDTKE